MFVFVFVGAGKTVTGIDRMVEFRDGTTIQLKLPPIELILDSGPANPRSQSKIKLSQTSQITFSEVPSLKRVDRIKSALQGLRDDNFAMRESAAQILSRIGSGFRKLLEDELGESFDPEIKWRLRRVLKELPIYASDEYDHVMVEGNPLRGEFQTWQMSVNYRGADILLNRKTVKSISVPPQPATSNPRITPIRTPNHSLVPLTSRKIDFERHPSGAIMNAGDNIQDAFVDWGIRLSTSIEESFVSVNHYHIDGSSGGKSAATHKPLYEGTITIGFCQPGNPGRAAGVSFVGCWLGIVKPGGTSMIAYGPEGNEIGRAITAEGKSQFIGIKSNIPIKRVDIVPTPEIDTNFALDDLIFDKPFPLFGAQSSAHFSLLLTNGDRINCRSIKHRKISGVTSTELVAKPGSPFTDEISIPVKHIRALVPPTGINHHHDPLGNHLWSKLSDGSRLILSPSPSGQLRSRVGDIPFENLKINCLWASPRMMQQPPDDLSIPRGGAAIILRNDPLYLTSYKVDNTKFSGTRPDGSIVNYSFNRLPTIWMKKPAYHPATSGRIVLTDGQVIKFGEQCLFKDCKFEDNGIQAITDVSGNDPAKLNKTIQLNYKFVRSVHFVTPGS